MVYLKGQAEVLSQAKRRPEAGNPEGPGAFSMQGRDVSGIASCCLWSCRLNNQVPICVRVSLWQESKVGLELLLVESQQE